MHLFVCSLLRAFVGFLAVVVAVAVSLVVRECAVQISQQPQQRQRLALPSGVWVLLGLLWLLRSLEADA